MIKRTVAVLAILAGGLTAIAHSDRQLPSAASVSCEDGFLVATVTPPLPNGGLLEDTDGTILLCGERKARNDAVGVLYEDTE